MMGRRAPMCPLCGAQTHRKRRSIDFTCSCGWWTPVHAVYGPYPTWIPTARPDGLVTVERVDVSRETN